VTPDVVALVTCCVSAYLAGVLFAMGPFDIDPFNMGTFNMDPFNMDLETP
jgi:hypothetical protein